MNWQSGHVYVLAVVRQCMQRTILCLAHLGHVNSIKSEPTCILHEVQVLTILEHLIDNQKPLAIVYKTKPGISGITSPKEARIPIYRVILSDFDITALAP